MIWVISYNWISSLTLTLVILTWVLMMFISQFIHSRILLNEASHCRLVTTPNFDSKFSSRMAKIPCLSALKEVVDSVTILLEFLEKFSEVSIQLLFHLIYFLFRTSTIPCRCWWCNSCWGRNNSIRWALLACNPWLSSNLNRRWCSKIPWTLSIRIQSFWYFCSIHTSLDSSRSWKCWLGT